MKKIITVTTVLGLVALFAACGGGDSAGAGEDDGTTAAKFDTIDDLPRATSPMATASASISRGASTGLNLLSATAADFDQNDSMAACEVFNVVRDSIVSAAQADTILCYVQNMNDAFGEVTDANGDAIDVYDGEWHIFDLNISGAEEGSPDKVKMQIVKDAAGSITSFEMFMCNETDGVLTQSEYTGETISGTSFSMTAKGFYASEEWSGSHQVDVTGTLDADSHFTEKEIVMKNTGGATGDDSNVNWQEGTLIQTLGGFTIDGYQRGLYSQEGYEGAYQQAAYGEGEMLGDTSTAILNLAMGDGAVNVDSAYEWNSDEWGEGDYDPEAEVYAWLGDTLAAVEPATGSDFYTAAAAGTIPTVATSVDFAFDADQTWDCSDDAATAVTLPEIQEDDIQTACAQYGAMQHSWIDCYSAIGQYQEP